MAPKPLDFLNRLPSVNELLEKQPVRALTDRWNRSTVAAGVRSFLDELRTDLRRRAADMPSVRDLAELAAKYVVAQQESIPRPAINATGRMFGRPWSGVPMPDAALERAVIVGRDFVLNPSTSRELAVASSSDPDSQLCRITDAPAAAVVHSYASAVWLALSALAAEREVLVSRAEVGDVDPANPLPKLATAARSVLKDIGTTSRATIADYESAASPRVAALLKFHADDYRVVGEDASADLEQLVSLARDRELVLIGAVGCAPLVEPPAGITWPQASVKASLDAGVDLVIARGDGLIGGPACGILVGTQQVIRRITDHPLYAALRLDSLQSGALACTLMCYESDENGPESLPVWQLLATPLENLKNRAERIAPQLAQAADIASAMPVETSSSITGALKDGGLPSYGVALSAITGQLDALRRRLILGDQPVIARREGDWLLLDLRTVCPRQDTLLVQAVASGAQEAQSSEAAESANGSPAAPNPNA